MLRLTQGKELLNKMKPGPTFTAPCRGETCCEFKSCGAGVEGLKENPGRDEVREGRREERGKERGISSRLALEAWRRLGHSKTESGFDLILILKAHGSL